MPIAIDCESYYDDEISVSKLGVVNYSKVAPPYLMSVYGEGTEFYDTPIHHEWVGCPNEYRRLHGPRVSHNASFDRAMLGGQTIRDWNCTADLSSYCGGPRSLKDASAAWLGIQVDKTQRDKMKGVRWEDLTREQAEEFKRYALADAKNCHALWEHLHSYWPDHEQALSRHTAEMGWRGIGIDLEMVERGIQTLLEQKFHVERSIPWAGLNDKGKENPLTSIKLLSIQCRKDGIEPPATTDSKSEEFEEWLTANGERAPYVLAVSQYRKVNRLLKVLESMKARSSGDTLHYALKYFGATHTGRWAGDTGLNVQNLPREASFGVNARECLRARAGKRLIIADFSQIEARIALYLGGNHTMLDAIRGGMDLYEAYARKVMHYRDPRPLKEVDNNLRQLAKCCVLALGFGVGPGKLKSTVKSWTGQVISTDEAQKQVDQFRAANRGITDLWTQLSQQMFRSKGGDFTVELPSGRKIIYRDVAKTEEGWKVTTQLSKPQTYQWGGKCTENICQGTARELLAHAILELEKRDLPVVMHVHDEIICEVDADQAQTALKEVEEVMTTTPEWVDGLPIAVEAKISNCYKK